MSNKVFVVPNKIWLIIRLENGEPVVYLDHIYTSKEMAESVSIQLENQYYTYFVQEYVINE